MYKYMIGILAYQFTLYGVCVRERERVDFEPVSIRTVAFLRVCVYGCSVYPPNL